MPSLILIVAILVIGWLLSSLVSANNARGNSQPPTDTNTPTMTATLAAVVVTESIPSSSPTEINTATVQVSTSPDNCTYTMYYWTYYWRSHPKAFSIENITIGERSYTKPEAIAMLKIKAQDEATALLQQFFTALFNTLNGADSSAVAETMVAAKEWLSLHSSGDELTDGDRQQAGLLIEALADYNHGVIGPGHCPDEPITPTPIPSTTPTPTQTPTRTPLTTSLSRTATATSRPDNDQPTQPPPEPTKEPKPTDKPTEKPTEPPPTEEPPTEAPTDVPAALTEGVSPPAVLTLSVIMPGIFGALVTGQLFRTIRKRF